MRPWLLWPMALLLLGAGGTWIDASSQDLHGYVRALSLDIRGVVPTAAELEAMEDAAGIDESTLDEWLSSPEFEATVIAQHRNRFWNELEVNLLNKRRIFKRDDVWFNNSRARYTRLIPQTHCGEFPADVDELNRPISWVTNEEDGSISEGYVMVAPYWDPDTPIPVCAFDAQLVEVSEAGVDCATEEAHEEPDCGCGPDLQWCMPTTVESYMEKAISADLNERVRHMLSSSEGYGSLFDGDMMFLNGQSTHFFRHIAPFDTDDYESPVPRESLPEIDFLDETWVPVTMEDHHDGVLTAPGWLLRHQTNRGRANRFYGAFLCSEFIPPETVFTGLSSAVVPSPNLQLREGCLGCHARLEPWAAYWARWGEASTKFRSADEYPAFSEECETCAITGLDCSDFCEDNYIVETGHADELPYLGWYAPYAFLAEDKSEHPDLGPLGWVSKTEESDFFGQCAVQQAADWLLSADANPTQIDDWTASFQADDDYRAMIKRIVMSSPYWGGAP
jgi:hypothetical protein